MLRFNYTVGLPLSAPVLIWLFDVPCPAVHAMRESTIRQNASPSNRMYNKIINRNTQIQKQQIRQQTTQIHIDKAKRFQPKPIPSDPFMQNKINIPTQDLQVQEGTSSHGRPAPPTGADRKPTPASRVWLFSLRGTYHKHTIPFMLFSRTCMDPDPHSNL